jgi:hypothetical protein
MRRGGRPIVALVGALLVFAASPSAMAAEAASKVSDAPAPAKAVGAPDSSQQPKSPRKPRIAVLSFRVIGDQDGTGPLLTEVLATEVAGARIGEVIGESDINALLSAQKQKRDFGSCDEDAACLAEMSGALGADYMIVGTLGKLGDEFRVELKLLEPRRARAVARAGESVPSRDQIMSAMSRALHDILSEFQAARPGAPQRVAQPLSLAPPVDGERAVAKEPAAPGRKPTATSSGAPTPVSTTASAAESSFPWRWVSIGVGTAALAGGAVFAVMARKSADDSVQATAQSNLPAWETARTKMKQRSLYADGLFVVGAVGVTVGTVQVLRRPSVEIALEKTPGGAIAWLGGRIP